MVLMSRVRHHSSGVMSMAWVQPTMPAKQQRMSMLPSCWTVSAMAAEICFASVTSTFWVTILAAGKSVRRASI